ncbi:MAG: SDR family NAD(P)-dependent oxidoreductase, partial [Vicingaceae bacterium]
MEQFAVITGASQGLGKSFAKELAARSTNLILVSLPNQKLPELSQELRDRFKITVHYFEIDFSTTENVIALAESINKNFNVFLLINNAGIGGTTRFTDVDTSYI